MNINIVIIIQMMRITTGLDIPFCIAAPCPVISNHPNIFNFVTFCGLLLTVPGTRNLELSISGIALSSGFFTCGAHS
jgi:hypothetical protein